MGCSSSRTMSQLEKYNEKPEFKTKFENIVYKLKKMREKSKKNVDVKNVTELDWIITTLQAGNLYEPEIQVGNIQSENLKEALAVLAQYSSVAQTMRLYNDTAKYQLVHENKIKKPPRYAGFIDKFKRSINNIVTNLEKKQNMLVKDIPSETIKLLAVQLSKLESFEFNVFEIDALIEKKTLYFTLNQILCKYSFFKETIPENKFLNFIFEIINGYNRDIPYHNDLHATDVLQTTYLQIEKGNLANKLKLDDLDILAILIAATCHDYKHNGLNNNYHMSIQSDIAICYNDVSVLENYHVSETFKTLKKPGNNIFENLKPEEYRILRRRMIEGILATDMASHAKHLLSLKSKLESLEIKGGFNVEKLIIPDNYSKNFENQQIILSMCIHTSDLSNPAKIPEVFDKWTHLIYSEFFNQGELEKIKGLPLSMLCDRSITRIKNSQVGFINFVVIPQFDAMLNVMPEIQPYMDAIRKNLKRYEELAKQEEIM